MSGSAESVQLEEVRQRARSLLSSSGLAQDVKAEVLTLASISLPASEKYRHLTAEEMLKENTAGRNNVEVSESLSRLVKALSILEKYGCNLTSPTRPRYWRSVKHNNPVFRTTVDAIKGGRRVLFLYGYTNQQIDGLSFPDEVTEPNCDVVAAVTLEVMTLRTEVDMLLKGVHPHPECFKDIIPGLTLQKEQTDESTLSGDDGQGDKPQAPPLLVKPTPLPRQTQPSKPPAAPPAVGQCNLCGGSSTLVCPSCDDKPFCDACDDLFHRHPSRANHKRDKIQKTQPENCSICGISSVSIQCSTCIQRLCLNCDRLFHSHPDRRGHSRTNLATAATSGASLSTWECAHCTTENEMRAVLCTTCDRPRLATPAIAGQDGSGPTSQNTEWQCKSCTVVNQGSSILCEVCERPRLATRPPVPPAPESGSKWTCQFCTFMNSKPSAVCEMCSLPSKDVSAVSAPQPLQHQPLQHQPLQHQPLQQPPSFTKEQPDLGAKPQPRPRANLELKRQKTMREDGLALIQQIREAEKRGVSPEEVYAALSMCGSSSINPCDWLTSELPHLLDEICAMAASVQLTCRPGNGGSALPVERDGQEQNAAPGGMKLSRAEAKLAWLAAGGNKDKAVRQLLRDRQVKMRELHSLGFQDMLQCEEALRQSGGDIKGALSLLQRPLMEPFHQRIWLDQPEPPINPKHPDKQRMCRRLLALYDLPSWGRCELALSLLQEPDVNYSLEDVVQAVKESHDREFIRRLLNTECPVCLSIFPRSKMQSLTSCQCSVCHECFRQHFTIAVRDKHIRDMVCPACSEPDINDPEQLDSYFSTLDIQLRDCLEPEVYDLFHKKLTEHALMKDPKFLWCCHCTSGFINDGNQLKVTCPSCRKSFCAQCKKPWEPQHQDVSCEQFQLWKRENDPEYQRQGLAGYLRDNGITCPECKFQYALTKGGCMHFTCSQCRHQFCSGCNNPYYKMECKIPQCKFPGLHAHHPRDCLFYLRDWDADRLQALLQRSGVPFNTDPSNETQTDACGVMEQKDEGGQPADSPCGLQTQPGQAGLCMKHYREYLVSLINDHSLDPAVLYETQELDVACQRYLGDLKKGDGEDDNAFRARQLKKLMEVPLGEKVPRSK